MSLSSGILTFREKIKQFIVEDKILSTIASVTVAIAAGNVIKSFVNDVIFPAFDLVFKQKGKKNKNYDPISYFHLIVFGKEFVTFMLVLVITFLFINFFISNIFNISKKDLKNATSTSSSTATIGAENTSTGAENTSTGSV